MFFHMCYYVFGIVKIIYFLNEKEGILHPVVNSFVELQAVNLAAFPCLQKLTWQWNIHEHLLTFIVVLHCWHEVDGSSGITTTGLPQAMFLQPGKT